MRDADAPLDSVMLGLEDTMGDVVDVRPDRFLREMRDHGDWNKACHVAGMTLIELSDLCHSNIKFDRAFVECHLEYLEEKVQAAMQKAQAAMQSGIEAARTIAYKNLEARHG